MDSTPSKRLSILIPTLTQRKVMLERLLRYLNPQLCKEVEVIIDADDGTLTIGVKRQRMLEKATGDYVVFIDDDDIIDESYVRLILEAMESDPDAIGFTTEIYVDNDLGTYVRCTGGEYKVPIHKRDIIRNDLSHEGSLTHNCPIKRSIALKGKFQHIRVGEDVDWINQLKKHINKEEYIDEVLYYYLFFTTPQKKQAEIDDLIELMGDKYQWTGIRAMDMYHEV